MIAAQPEPLIPEQGGSAPFQVSPAAGSRLEQLHAAYVDAKARADEAAAQLKVVTDGIKAELTALAPEQKRVALIGAHGPALSLTYSESWRVDSTRLKAEDPETYVRYAKKTGAWTLKAAKNAGN